MFYSQFILAKKGPLGTIWIAAHLERKLRKNQVADTDIGVSVDSILSTEVPIALRLSSHLLLGVVRIYSKKVNYLFDDCSEALLKVKQAFRSAAVDLPPEESKAPYHSITLPETFDLDDFELPDTELFQGNFVDHHVSTKEQITLQDRMDGVDYSTSRFGLDERFGDGDASQIGLDLDEELLLNKGTSSGHGVLLTSCADPKTSFEPSSAEKGDGLDEEMHEASEPIATNCIIEAPSTPGLVEGPNLPSAEEALIGDDYMEEDHDPAELAAGDKGGSASTHGTDEPALQDNDRALDNQKIEKSMSRAGSPSTAEPMTLINSSTIACVSDSNQVLNASEVHVECAQSGSFRENDLNGACSGEFREAQGTRLNDNMLSLNASPKSPALSSQPDHCQDKFSVNGLCSESESTCFIQKSSLEPVIEAEGKFHIDSYSEKEGDLDFIRPEASETSNAGAGADLISGSKPILQPCNLHNSEENTGLDNMLSVPNLPSKDFGVGSEGMFGQDAPNVCVAELQDVTDLNLNEDQLLEAAPCYKLDEQHIISENVELPEGNDSEMPSPEKMLSLPDVPVGQSNELVVGSTTPEREALVQGDQHDTMGNISGKKRSFAESTMTLQSLNSVESSEATQPKRMMGVVPNDDDLLSSILVGRRSTVLKVKSTPPAFDLVSSKHSRYTPRSGAHKRKVLVDDSMVLHGDTIRQQLVTTEDIRRVRKKAPSTHPEIWILQKQFLEDEMFHEPIFTGMSAELISLHCQPFDLRQTKLLQDNGNKTQSTAPDMIGSPDKSIVGEETEFEGTSLPSVATDEIAQQPECISVPSNIRESSDVGGNALENERMTGGGVGHTLLIAKDDSGRQSGECILIQSNMRESSDVGDNALRNERITDGEVEHTPSLLDISDNRVEMETEIVRSREPEPNSDEAVPMTRALPDCSLPANDENILTEERTSEEGRTDEHETVNKAEFPKSDLNYNDRDLPLDHQREDLEIESSNPLGDEDGTVNKAKFPESDLKHDDTDLHLDYQKGDLEIESSNPVGGEVGIGNTVFFEVVNTENQSAESQMFMEPTATASDHPIHGNLSDLEADLFEHDTDFLNLDDDEIAEEDDNGMPNAEGPQILDNSGWSTRTRAVANYLQVLFQKEAQHGRTGLHLDNLLVNKSRKEASRMFFETLVLKTRDYIHVDQPDSFGNVSIKPRARLLKSDF